MRFKGLMSRLPTLAGVVLIAGCVETAEPVFGKGGVPFQPIAQGYARSCLVHGLEVGDCDTIRIERLGANTGLWWGPDESTSSTVAFERMDQDRFVVQIGGQTGGQKRFVYLLGKRGPGGEVILTAPECKIVLGAAQKLSAAGVALDPASNEKRCRPKTLDAQSLRAFFTVVADTHVDVPVWHVSALSNAEGQRAFDEELARKVKESATVAPSR